MFLGPGDEVQHPRAHPIPTLPLELQLKPPTFSAGRILVDAIVTMSPCSLDEEKLQKNVRHFGGHRRG